MQPFPSSLYFFKMCSDFVLAILQTNCWLENLIKKDAQWRCTTSSISAPLFAEVLQCLVSNKWLQYSSRLMSWLLSFLQSAMDTLETSLACSQQQKKGHYANAACLTMSYKLFLYILLGISCLMLPSTNFIPVSSLITFISLPQKVKQAQFCVKFSLPFIKEKGKKFFRAQWIEDKSVSKQRDCNKDFVCLLDFLDLPRQQRQLVSQLIKIIIVSDYQFSSQQNSIINSLMILAVALLLALSVGFVNAQIPSASFASTQMTISQANGSAFISNAPSNYRFSFSFQYPFIGARFSWINTDYISFYTNVMLNSSANGELEFNALDNMVVYKMSFTIIVTAPTPYPSMSVEAHMINQTNLSNFSYTSSNNSQNLTFTSTLFFSHNDFVVIPYLAYLKNFRSTNPQIALNLSNIMVNSYNFVLTVNISYYGVLFYAKTTIIIFDKKSFNKVYFASFRRKIRRGYPSGVQIYFNLSSPSLPLTFGPNFRRNCIFGINIISPMASTQIQYSLFDLSNIAGSTFTNITDGGYYLLLDRDAFCVVDCPIGWFNNALGGCDYCNITYCLNCSNSSYCFSCGSNYTLSSNGTSCDCLAGNPTIKGYCTNIIGCLIAVLSINKAQCVSCDTANKFYLNSNKTCSCNQGYSLIGKQCLPVCGDGLFVSNEQCDDGNTLNGDGCSSTCEVEKNYACQNGSSSQQSDCYYTRPNFKLVLSQAYKIPTENVGVFVFSFVPALSILSKVNFSSAINFTLAPQHSIADIFFSSGKLTVTVAYDQDLQGNSAVLGLTIDKRILIKTKLSVIFTVKSSNYPLVVSKSYDQIDFLRLSINIMVGVALILFAVGSWAHKMIGVETLFPFLFVYFTLFLGCVGDDQLFYPLTQLRHIANYGELFSSALQDSYNAADSLSLRVSFAENNAAIAVVMIGGILALGAFVIYRKVQEERNVVRDDEEEKYRGNNTALYRNSFRSILFYPPLLLLFGVLLLPVSLGFLPYTLITAFLSSNHVTQQSKLQCTVAFFIITVSALIIGLQMLLTTKRKALYFTSFVTNSFLSAALLALSPLYPSVVFALAVLSLCFLITLIAFPPYISKLHIIAAIINQTVVCAWMGIIITMGLSDISVETKKSLVNVVVGMLIVVDAVGGVRVAWHLYFYKSQKGMLEQNRDCQQMANNSKDSKRQPIEKKDYVADFQNPLNKAFHKNRKTPILNTKSFNGKIIEKNTDITTIRIGESVDIVGKRPLKDGTVKQIKAMPLKQNLLERFA